MNTPNHDSLVKMAREATHDVFSTMLGLELQDVDAYLDETAHSMIEGVVSLIGLAGPWAGTGSIYCSEAFARHISGQLLGMEFATIDQEVLDAIGEVTNMVIGSVKTRLEEDVGPLGLSIPTVIYGRNFAARTMGSSKWTVVPFLSGGERLEVQICLAEQKDGQRHKLSFAGHLGIAT
jgi:chemotaxis protein CheX